MTNGVPRLLLVTHGWPPERIGGVELYARALHDGLRALGVPCSVFCAGEDEERLPERRQVRGPLPRPASFSATLRRPDVEAAFAEWIADWRPDLVHFHHLTHLSLGLVGLARRAGAPALMTLHDYWLVCARGQLVDRALRRCLAPSPERCARCVGGQLALRPWMAAIRGRLPEPSPTLVARVREPLGRFAGRQGAAEMRERARLVAEAVAQVSRFAAPSRDLASRISELGIPAERIDLLPLPLVHPIRPAPDPEPGPVRFLFVGSLIPTKGPDLLLEAFAKLPAGAARLRIAGPSPPWDLDPGYAQRLRARAADLPEATIEAPFGPGGAQALLDAADVFVLPSRWEENSPLVLREASAAGLRIVAAARGGCAELVPEARFFEPEEPSSLFRALAAECRVGRRRVTPRTWDGPEAHARAMLCWYRAQLSAGRG